MKTLILALAIVAFASASASAAKLTAAPSDVKQGGTLVLKGSGFNGGAHLSLFVSVAGRRVRVGWAVTDPWGRFRAPIDILGSTYAGRYVASACVRGSCAKGKASARFRIVKG